MKLLFILIFAISGCSRQERSDERPLASAISQLEEAQDKRLDELNSLAKSHVGGWLVDSDCDGALWSYLAAAFAKCPATFNPRASESVIGKYSRKSNGACWTPEAGDIGSKTTWSGDMGKALIIYGWVCKDVNLLQDHADYGFHNQWIMGDGEEGYLLERAFYRPSIRGELYSAIYHLGGEDDAARLWPTTYSSGLTDYQAHLQVLSIWLRSDIAEVSGDAIPKDPNAKEFFTILDISSTMYERLKEHAARDPLDPFFQSVYALYSGDFTQAVKLCTKEYLPSEYVGEYVRCNDQKLCQLSHLIKSCGILLRGYR